MIGLLNADALRIPLADRSVHMIATSPPYYGLRDYGLGQWEGGRDDCDHEAPKPPPAPRYTEGGELWRNIGNEFFYSTCPKCGATRSNPGIGLENLHDCLGWARGENCGVCFVCRLRLWARECWRVLRDDGVMFLNLGDSYASSGIMDNGNHTGLAAAKERYDGRKRNPANESRMNGSVKPVKRTLSGLKPKDLIGIPWRVALALQADGWWLRSDIIWAKSNPMPESVTDRPTKAHEYVFLLSKAKRYFYDADAVREGFQGELHAPGNKTHNGRLTSSMGHFEEPDRIWGNPNGRNRRTVWDIATAPYPGAHFACYPPALVEPMIKAGTSERGCCPECGAQWERVVEKGFTDHGGKTDTAYTNGSTAGRLAKLRQAARENGSEYVNQSKTTGFRPTCSHYDNHYRRDYPEARSKRKRQQRRLTGDWWKRVRKRAGLPHWKTVPCTVLDTFAGSGTTGEVARELGRHAILLDLSFDYLKDQAKSRLELDRLEAWGNGIKANDEAEIMDLPLFSL